MNRLRRCKIVATLGPASKDEAAIERLWRAGADLFRINMSHTDPEGMRERVAMIRAVEKRVGRSIGILVDLQGPKLRVGTFAGGGADLVVGREFIFDSDPAPGDATRVFLPHPEILEALAPGHVLLIDDGRLRLHVIEAKPRPGGRGGRRRRAHLQPQGREPARHRNRLRRHDRQGPRRSRSGGRDRRRLDRPVLRAARRGCGGSEEDRRRTRHGHGQDRKAAGHRPARRDSRRRRRADGGARRSRRGNAAGESARPAEAPHPRGAPDGASGGRGDANARIDDHLACADPRRSVRRRHRGVRRRRRHHAVGGKRLRRLSGRGGGDDEPHRRGGGAGRRLSLDHRRPARRARAHRRRRGRGRRARHGGNPRSQGPGRLDLVRRDGLARGARTPALADPGADAQSRHGAAADRGLGRAIGRDQGRQ